MDALSCCMAISALLWALVSLWVNWSGLLCDPWVSLWLPSSPIFSWSCSLLQPELWREPLSRSMVDAALPGGAPRADVCLQSKVSCRQGNCSWVSTLIHLLPCGYVHLGMITGLLNTEVPHQAREGLCFGPSCICISRRVHSGGAALGKSRCVDAACKPGNFWALSQNTVAAYGIEDA